MKIFIVVTLLVMSEALPQYRTQANLRRIVRRRRPVATVASAPVAVTDQFSITLPQRTDALYIQRPQPQPVQQLLQLADGRFFLISTGGLNIQPGQFFQTSDGRFFTTFLSNENNQEEDEMLMKEIDENEVDDDAEVLNADPFDVAEAAIRRKAYREAERRQKELKEARLRRQKEALEAARRKQKEEEEAKRKAEEEKAAAEARKKAEEEKAAAEARKKAEEDARKKAEEDRIAQSIAIAQAQQQQQPQQIKVQQQPQQFLRLAGNQFFLPQTQPQFFIGPNGNIFRTLITPQQQPQFIPFTTPTQRGQDQQQFIVVGNNAYTTF